MLKLKFGNAISVEETDARPDIRLYATRPGNPIAIWNMGYTVVFKESFELQDFPFDSQDLQIVLRQDDSRTWNNFDLTVSTVQFNVNALELAEWRMVEPLLKRSSAVEPHLESTAIMRVRRLPKFYISNIITLMGMLSLLGFTVFALPAKDLSDRVNIILTLLLTAVAFKFVIADAIPKIGYNTLLDEFVLSQLLFLFLTVVVCMISNVWIRVTAANRTDLLEKTQGFEGPAPALTSLAIFLLLNGGWALRVHYVFKSRVRSSEHAGAAAIDKVDGRDWYAFGFCNPDFMPAPKLWPAATSEQTGTIETILA
jgi:hypothetical protein